MGLFPQASFQPQGTRHQWNQFWFLYWTTSGVIKRNCLTSRQPAGLIRRLKKSVLLTNKFTYIHSFSGRDASVIRMAQAWLDVPHFESGRLTRTNSKQWSRVPLNRLYCWRPEPHLKLYERIYSYNSTVLYLGDMGQRVAMARGMTYTNAERVVMTICHGSPSQENCVGTHYFMYVYIYIYIV